MSGFERFIAYALIPIVLYVIFYFVDKQNDKKAIINLEKEHIIIRTPNAFLWIGIIGTLIFSIFILFTIFPNNISSPIGKNIWWVLLIFCSFDLLGIYIIFNTLVWKIEIFKTKDYFLYKPLFKTYKIKYKDCLWFTIKDNGVLVIKTNTKNVNANTFFTNYEFLLAMLVKHGVKEIKEKN